MVSSAVVFDLDGVLIDSEPVWQQVRHQVVTEYGGTWVAEADRRVMGMNTAEWSSYLVDELGVRLSPAELADVVIAGMVGAYRHGGLPLIDGAPEVVHDLAGAGFPLAVASSSPPQIIEAAVAGLGLAGLFAALVSSDDVGRGTPAPAVYLTAAERLGTSPADCAAVEDSPNGIRAALAAGLAVVAIPNPPPGTEADVPDGVPVLRRLAEVTPALVATLRPLGDAGPSRRP